LQTPAKLDAEEPKIHIPKLQAVQACFVHLNSSYSVEGVIASRAIIEEQRFKNVSNETEISRAKSVGDLNRCNIVRSFPSCFLFLIP
jgi:hypothetical protein